MHKRLFFWLLVGSMAILLLVSCSSSKQESKSEKPKNAKIDLSEGLTPTEYQTQMVIFNKDVLKFKNFGEKNGYELVTAQNHAAGIVSLGNHIATSIKKHPNKKGVKEDLVLITFTLNFIQKKMRNNWTDVRTAPTVKANVNAAYKVIIDLYPTTKAGKQAKKWLEKSTGQTYSNTKEAKEIKEWLKKNGYDIE